MSAIDPPHRDELGARELVPFACAFLVLFVILLLEASPKEMRIYAAVAAVASSRFALLDVINEQYRRIAERTDRRDDAEAFSARGFRAKQQARLWGLLTVTATGASFLGTERGLWTLAILLAVVASVLLNLSREVRRHPLGTGPSARALTTVATGCLAGAAAALVVAVSNG